MNKINEWLKRECPKEEVKYLNEDDKIGQYIPIGLVEQNLDEFDEWGTQDFRFNMQKVDKNWVASGSVLLYVLFDGKRITRHGAVTFPVSSKTNNSDYEGTTLSLCIASAAKKLGKRFGRHLNGRLDIGEQISTIDLQEIRKQDAAIDEVNECETEDQLKELFDNKYPQYQKNREFTIAISNRKQIIKIKATNNG